MSALVILNPSATSFTLDDVATHLSTQTRFKCERTTWTGLYTTIPQILVCTPVPITVQLNSDPEYVPEEIREMADCLDAHLSQESLDVFRSATARFEIQSATPDAIKHIEGHGLFRAQATDADTRSPELRSVLESLAIMVDGWVMDSMHGFFWAPESKTWINRYP